MNHIVPGLIMYAIEDENDILSRMSAICAEAEAEGADCDKLRKELFAVVKRLLVVATDYGFDENLWQNYLTFTLITQENPFSVTCEKLGASEGSANHFAKSDYALFMKLFHYDFSALEKKLGTDCFTVLTNYRAIVKPELMYNRNVSEKVRALSSRLAKCADVQSFFDEVTGFYKSWGVGMFGLNKAFRIREEQGKLAGYSPINNMQPVRLDDLVGCEEQKRKLRENTEAFVAGRKANNCLLFGDSGTGKSTSIKAIINEYYDEGLRMIEVYKHQFKYLSQIISGIKIRNYKFIIYMDDLSFEENETEYKYLKAVIEGGAETRPDNVLIYATSNRRHIIKETWKDKNDMEFENGLHRSDTIEEKMSLVNRFGVTISFSKPSQKEYFAIVEALAARAGIEMPAEELRLEANKWELAHGGISGRTAQQFINHLLGRASAE